MDGKRSSWPSSRPLIVLLAIFCRPLSLQWGLASDGGGGVREHGPFQRPSYIGVIDTGDLVIVRDQSSVVTYVEGYVDHYRKLRRLWGRGHISIGMAKRTPPRSSIVPSWKLVYNEKHQSVRHPLAWRLPSIALVP